jgi:thermitase
MKTLKLILCLLIVSMSQAYAQKTFNNEILVFFRDGVVQETKQMKEGRKKVAHITKKQLKDSLIAIGIVDSLIDVAMPNFDESDTLKVLKDGIIMRQANMTKLYRIKATSENKKNEMIKYLRKLPEVLYAEPNGTVSPCVIPNDTRFAEQWGLNNGNNPNRDIHAKMAWDIYKGNSNNIIAIIDGGTQITHEDLSGKISGGDVGFGWDSHGIHTSGIAAAISDNATGVSGVDWNARIHPKRIDTLSDDVAIYQAIVDAVNYNPNVFVLNNSWALTDPGEIPGRYSTTVRQAFAYAYKANRVCIASMGNHQQTLPNVTAYPAGFGNVIAVGATDNNDNIANFSAHGNHISVCAPGVNILSTINNGYGYMSGTSMAAPFVSGLASLLKGYNKNLSNDDIKNIIQLSADKVPAMNNNNFNDQYGYGRINAANALAMIRDNTLRQWTSTGGTVYSSTNNYATIFLAASGLTAGNYVVKRHEVRTTITFPEQFAQLVGVWGRGVGTTGCNLESPVLGEGFCEVISSTNNSATLRTYLYEVTDLLGLYLGWYPVAPANVKFAYTVLGTSSPTISGPTSVCPGTNATFTANNFQGTVTWSCSSGLSLVANGNTATVTNNLALNSSANKFCVDPTGWIRAEIPGTSIAILQKITINSNCIIDFNLPTSAYTTGSYILHSTIETMVPTTVGWVVKPSVNGTAWSEGDTEYVLSISQNGLYIVTATTYNSCGSYSISKSITISGIDFICPTCPPILFDLPIDTTDFSGVIDNTENLAASVYPNPTSSEVTFEITNDANNEVPEPSFNVNIVDINGTVVYSGQKKGKKFTLSTASFRNGIYNVIVSDGITSLQKKLIVKH